VRNRGALPLNEVHGSLPFANLRKTYSASAQLSTAKDQHNLASEELLLGESDCVAGLRRIIQFSAGKIARAAAFPRELREHLLQQCIHIFPDPRMLRKKQLPIARLA